MRARRWWIVLVPLLVACGSAEPSPPPPTAGPGTITVPLDDRPFALHLPPSYRPGTPAPLLVLLHGYSATSVIQEAYFKLVAESDRRGFLYAMPDGTTDRQGNQFWNAGPACCDNFRTGVDDVAYLRKVIGAVKARYTVDAARVYVVGHSNGGFMALRMACDHADEITAVAALAGAATNDPASCQPARPVSVLLIHGTADDTIRYDGDTVGERGYPSAEGTAALWRERDGCTGPADRAAPPLDLDSSVEGAETSVATWAEGCRDGSAVGLWSIVDGSHVPPLSERFAPAVAEWLLGHAAPVE
jgi:polyhydroxybutyrate depolymerase